MSTHRTTPQNTQTHGANARRRGLRDAITVRLGVALVCCVLLGAGVSGVLASDASAGIWAVESCSLPGGQPAPIEGWQSEPDGGGPYTGATDSCPTGGLDAIDSAQWEQIRGTGAIWTYTAPAGATIAGGDLLVSLTAPQGVAYVATPKNAYDGNVLVNCQFNLACGPSNALGGWIENASIPITHTGGTQIWAVAQCVGPGQPGTASANCAQNDGAYGVNALMRISQADIELTDASTPEGASFSGSLLDAPATGTASLNFTASESAPGPGIYTVTASLDGHTLSTSTPNTNGGKCATLGRNANSVPEYTAQQPCPLSEQINIPINTAGVTDGHHELTVTVADAAEVTATVYDGTITTHNAPTDSSAPTIIAPSQVFAGAMLSTHPGAWSAPSGAGSIAYSYQWESCDAQGNNCQTIAGAQTATYTPTPPDIGHTLRVIVNASDNDGLTAATSSPTSVVLSAQGTLGAPNGPGTSPGSTGAGSPVVGQGAPNGNGASEAAVIRLGVRHTITRPFSRRAFTLAGRLLDSHGHPISGSELDVLQQIIGSGQTQVITHVRTRTDGSFLARVPAGPSRLIEIVYRAFSADTNDTAQAKTTELVGAGVQLTVAPRQTSSNGTIVLTGQVLGPVPPHGTIVDLLVHYRGQWEPFRTPQTDPRGHFEAVYQFQGGIGRFPFRALVPAGQAGFPFSSGYSKVVDVTAG